MVGRNPFRITNVLLFCALIFNLKFDFGACFSDVSREAQEFLYRIDEPTFAFNGFRLNLDYTFSSSIVDEHIRYSIVNGKDCEGPIISDAEIDHLVGMVTRAIEAVLPRWTRRARSKDIGFMKRKL